MNQRSDSQRESRYSSGRYPSRNQQEGQPWGTEGYEQRWNTSDEDPRERRNDPRERQYDPRDPRQDEQYEMARRGEWGGGGSSYGRSGYGRMGMGSSQYGNGGHYSGGGQYTGSSSQYTTGGQYNMPSMGQGQFAGRGPKGYKRSDERILEEINEDLTVHPDLDASGIEVEVKEGEVTLTGTVPSRQCKRTAEEIAVNVSGVQDVTNQLRVQKESNSEQHNGSQKMQNQERGGKQQSQRPAAER